MFVTNQKFRGNPIAHGTVSKIHSPVMNKTRMAMSPLLLKLKTDPVNES